MAVPFEGAYSVLPVAVQNAAISAYGWWLDRKRYSGRFSEYVQFLEESQWWSGERLWEWQNTRLREIVKHAIAHVPLYRERYGALGITADDLRSQEDLQFLPVLTRQDVIERAADLISVTTDKASLTMGHTSGTTGSPLQVYYDASTTQMTYAMLDRQYRWASARFGHRGDRVAVLRGNVIVPLSQKSAPFWRYNRYHNQLLLSAFHLSDTTIPAYIEEMRRFNPAIVDGYPSTLYVLARYLLQNGLVFPVRAVISASETLYEFQREAIESAFSCKVFDYLAAAERVIFSTECDRHEGHHIALEYGITEFADKENKPVTAGSEGLMLCTSLHNMAMPLIRYATSDVSSLLENPCSCGRALPLMSDVTTKAEDIISLSDGRLISPSVLTHPFKPMHSVSESQIVQNTQDSIEIRIVPREGYSTADTEHLLSEFSKRLGKNVSVSVKLVEKIERTASGKFKWVVSNVKNSIRMPNS
ncbi:MAG: hypothetical protein R3E82_05485 [Pseudomonadales bacterium]